uniref:LNR domain-containing protein n=1 Tax=Gongylonema pulchrum TaxID=637853 RepID=A0A183DXE0_9BILA
LHYMDGKCDWECASAECGFDGSDCGMSVTHSDSNAIMGIIFDGQSYEILRKLLPLLGSIAQLLHAPVHLSVNSEGGGPVYGWSYKNGVGEQIDLKEKTIPE